MHCLCSVNVVFYIVKDMKKIFLFVAFSLLLCTSAYSQTFEELRKVYHTSINDGKRVITGFHAFGMSDKVILANSMRWAIQNVCEVGRDHLFDVNVEKNEFSFNVTLEEMVNGKPKYTFYCKARVRINEDKLIYSIYDIQYKTDNLLSLGSVTPLEKLNPEKKPKQKEILDSFEKLASSILNKMFDAVVANECAPIEHWQEIHLQRAIKGLKPDECLLAFGKPQNIYEPDSNGIQWSYNLNFVLIFKDDVVVTIIR